jgi:16S rRNA (guanine966-N2)-methyltransferase
MSIVQPDLANARVLDLYAGSGALGLEALSRGAAEAHFVELATRSLAALRENIARLGAGDRAVVHRVSPTRPMEWERPTALPSYGSPCHSSVSWE